MRLKGLLSGFGLVFVLGGAALAPSLAGCSSEAAESDETVTGSRNQLGLRLTFDESTRQVEARMNRQLEDGEKMFVRVRRGTLTEAAQRELSCGDLSAHAVSGKGVLRAEMPGTVAFAGPVVEPQLLELRKLYDSPEWLRGKVTAAMQDEVRKGTDVVVEACVTQGDQVRAKVQTSILYASDLARNEAKFASARSALQIQSNAAADAAPEPRIDSMEEYAALCVQEMGEIPFFKKLETGKYETFDCRDFVGSNGTGTPAAMPGVEAALLPLTVDEVRKDTCETNKTFPSYDCVSKCDKAQYLSEGCEPGPTVASARNDQGTHWVMLCRKVEDTGTGMLQTKKFNDIAMIGHNPQTGKSCFFQNKINSGTDGGRVPHPADIERSRNIWDSPKGYCMGCHSADAFVHSPWIDGALRTNGKAIVPKMGQHPDFEISWNDAPYYVLNMDAQGWTIPQQLVSEKGAACTTCHRIAEGSMMSDFTRWGTGTGDSYYSKITDTYKAFEKSHWMPTRLDGITAETWPTSKWGKAVDHILQCADSGGAECTMADIPRGPLNPSRPTP